MNECQNLQQQLDEYLSDRLSDFAKRRIDNHLRQCATCAEEISQYREAIDELRSISHGIEIEPSLPLQYRVDRLAEMQTRSEPIDRYHYLSLILFGVLM